MALRRADYGLLALILVLTAIKGTLWSIAIPLWQGPDENLHFASVQFIAEHGWLPGPGDVYRDDENVLAGELADIAGACLPEAPDGCRVVYNQFPILLAGEAAREAVHRAVLATRLEATLLYPNPIHRIYDDTWDGAGADPFPDATAVSRRLMLIPVHPLVSRKALARAWACRVPCCFTTCFPTGTVFCSSWASTS